MKANLVLSLFLALAMTGAYLHNWIISLAGVALLVVGYMCETAPTSQDPESDSFAPPEDNE